jgi:hypothetical protein
MIAHFQNILNGWKNQFCQQFDVLGVSDFSGAEIYAAEPSTFNV